MWSYYCFCFLFVSSIAFVALEEISPIVSTTYGDVQGTVVEVNSENETGFSYFAFRGIPYAKPPIGELRFKPPQKPEAWTGVKNCSSYGNICPQVTGKDVVGNEDCLFLNVYTSKISTTQLRPVMLWLHGSTYVHGYGHKYGADYIMEEPVVLLTLNYRLHAFGFLATNDSNAPGNVGLKDVIMALEWVQENIASFGGDPKKVTLAGWASGVAMAQYLSLSSKAPGLFHQIIGHTGAAVTVRLFQRNVLNYTYALAKRLRVKGDTPSDVIKGLQEIDYKRITLASTIYTSRAGYKQGLDGIPFMPMIEYEHEDAVITQSPYEAFESGNFYKVPFLLGYNNEEGSLGIFLVKNNHLLNIENYDKVPETYISPSFNNPENKELGQKIRDHFMGNSSAVEDEEKLTKFFTQDIFVRSIRKTVDFLRKYSPGYLYRFSYKGTHTTKTPGVQYGEDLQYLFNMKGYVDNLTETDVLTRKRMVRMWTNFVTTGDPTPECDCMLNGTLWCAIDQKSPVPFLEFGETLETGFDPDQEDYEFWEKMFQEYGQKPFITY